ncbi:hypothetical protein NDU88_004127 [Pleurodeles waltl]|uniref:Uncharacterized protein n=1 Tax=Pleurodeles waltl TaxID=8319 RepID=A0AAV7QC15_PLEWA|nr:hypothetical protein NDU88_004127 [Pleurodeles waltl]
MAGDPLEVVPIRIRTHVQHGLRSLAPSQNLKKTHGVAKCVARAGVQELRVKDADPLPTTPLSSAQLRSAHSELKCIEASADVPEPSQAGTKPELSWNQATRGNVRCLRHQILGGSCKQVMWRDRCRYHNCNHKQ